MQSAMLTWLAMAVGFVTIFCFVSKFVSDETIEAICVSVFFFMLALLAIAPPTHNETGIATEQNVTLCVGAIGK